ncbi:MAG: helix-turn-helix transcriptional regulator [Pseudomonadota bacterium]|nr:helix-turn-helix transcriptional regulator [Pseudomonadota bacterium]
MTFAQRLHALRKERGLTQKALAELCGTHTTQIQRYESGETQPNLDALRKLALGLHVSADLLVFDEDERGPDTSDLKLAFEAVSDFDDEDREMVKKLIIGLILQHQNKKLTAGLRDETRTPPARAAG